MIEDQLLCSFLKRIVISNKWYKMVVINVYTTPSSCCDVFTSDFIAPKTLAF